MKLPMLKRVVVKNLSLYCEPIHRTFYPGINMIIGGNGIGKTTLVNTILFGLVGAEEYEFSNTRTGKAELVSLIEPDYFRKRIDPADHDKAQVLLTFAVGDSEVTIVRALFRPKILSIEIKDQTGRRHLDQAHLSENFYRKLMEELLDTDHFEAFVFLVAHLLLFDENRRKLAWDEDAQNRIIRLLCTSRQFNAEFEELSKRATELDTRGRHKSETRKDLKKHMDLWATQQEQSVSGESDEPGEVEAAQLQSHIAELDHSIEVVRGKIAELNQKLQVETEHVKSLITETHDLEAQKIPLGRQIEELEHQFYSEIYENMPPQYVLILEGLIRHGTCQVCGSSGRDLTKLGKKLKAEGRCIVCRNPIPDRISEAKVVDKDQLATQINALRTKLDELEVRQKDRAKARESAEAEIRRIQALIIEARQEQGNLESRLFDQRTKYSLAMGSKTELARVDREISDQEHRIHELDLEIENLYRKRDKIRTSLGTMNQELLRKMTEVNEKLTPLFSRFASQFLGMDCELVVVSEKKRTGKPVAFMHPRFNGHERHSITEVSESQQFFLEQAFRMALITWFTQETSSPTFFIVETPEGSLDLAYERNVADMYYAFAEDGHTVIITSNLNSSNFLAGLYKQLDNAEKQKRTLNLLHYGRLSPVQEKERSEFNRRMVQLRLPVF